MSRLVPVAVVLMLLALACAGCDKGARAGSAAGTPAIGQGSAFHPQPLSGRVASRQPIDGLTCEPNAGSSDAAHLELFADGRAVIVAAGIGIAPPQTVDGAYVRAGSCLYPLRTHEPTGIIEFSSPMPLTLGQLFDVWGQPLSQTRLLSFTTSSEAPVQAFVNGNPASGDVRGLELHHHDEIVIEIGAYVPPHGSYRFPPGR